VPTKSRVEVCIGDAEEKGAREGYIRQNKKREELRRSYMCLRHGRLRGV